MKKIQKNKVALSLCSMLVFLVMTLAAFPVSAYETSEAARTDTVQPRYEGVCGTLPYHQVFYRARGTARKSDGSYTVDNGYMFQCTRCYHVIVTTGNPLWGERIGLYSVSNPGEPMYGGAIISDIVGAGYDTTLPEYQFHG